MEENGLELTDDQLEEIVRWRNYLRSITETDVSKEESLSIACALLRLLFQDYGSRTVEVDDLEEVLSMTERFIEGEEDLRESLDRFL